MDRLQAFESMLGAVQRGYEEASQKMQALNAQGKEKTVTYKQHMANKLLYMNMLSLYRLYGLLDQDPAQQSFPAGGSPLTGANGRGGVHREPASTEGALLFPPQKTAPAFRGPHGSR